MPPKAKTRAKYTAPRYYYQGAYRERIKVLRTGWTNAQITSTVAWMWAHVATQAERTECEQLHEQGSPTNTFTADDTKIPATVKVAKDPASIVAAITQDQNAQLAGAGTVGDAGGLTEVGAGTNAPEAPATEGRIQSPASSQTQTRVGATGPQVGPTQTDTRVNTTRFNYMPLSMKETHSVLPPLNGELDTAQKKRSLLEAELGDPNREGKRWRGAHFLGAGTTGNCTLWVQTDENENIEERLAVRDIVSMHQQNWVNPTNWRDQLPREIAIMRRLKDQGGDTNNIYRYFGHRIDMYQRRYRVYMEVCDLGNIEGALEHYSRLWRRRRNMYKWSNYVERQPEIQKARDNPETLPEESVEEDVRDTKREIVKRVQEAPENHSDREFGDMSDLEDWFDDELEDHLPEVIPEAFLWHVFDQLVDAALIMQRGANPFVPMAGEEKWKEIVHKDMHTGNIFMKPHEEGFFGNNERPDPKSKRERSFVTFTKSEYPNVVLADFDTAFFDLQDGDDEYQDNPLHYMMGNEPGARGGRYPPEAFWQYQDWRKLTKFTSASDVWGIGQIMWNLAMNFPHSSEYVAPFYDDANSHNGVFTFDRVNNGKEYTARTLEQCLMTGDRPFKATRQYSDVLKKTIRRCLNYRPQHRIKVQDLKALTAQNRELHMNQQGPADDLIVRIKGEMQGFQVGRAFVYVPPTDENDQEA